MTLTAAFLDKDTAVTPASSVTVSGVSVPVGDQLLVLASTENGVKGEERVGSCLHGSSLIPLVATFSDPVQDFTHRYFLAPAAKAGPGVSPPLPENVVVSWTGPNLKMAVGCVAIGNFDTIPKVLNRAFSFEENTLAPEVSLSSKTNDTLVVGLHHYPLALNPTGADHTFLYQETALPNTRVVAHYKAQAAAATVAMGIDLAFAVDTLSSAIVLGRGGFLRRYRGTGGFGARRLRP